MKSKTSANTKSKAKTKPKSISKSKASNKMKTKAKTKTSMKKNSESGISKNKVFLSITISFFVLLAVGLFMNRKDIFPAGASTGKFGLAGDSLSLSVSLSDTSQRTNVMTIDSIVQSTSSLANVAPTTYSNASYGRTIAGNYFIGGRAVEENVIYNVSRKSGVGTVVVALGTNDILGSDTIPTISEEVKKAASQIEVGDCVVWVVPRLSAEKNKLYPPLNRWDPVKNKLKLYTSISEAMKAVRPSCTCTYQWNPLATDLQSDGIHLNAAGRRKYAYNIHKIASRMKTEGCNTTKGVIDPIDWLKLKAEMGIS